MWSTSTDSFHYSQNHSVVGVTCIPPLWLILEKHIWDRRLVYGFVWPVVEIHFWAGRLLARAKRSVDAGGFSNLVVESGQEIEVVWMQTVGNSTVRSDFGWRVFIGLPFSRLTTGYHRKYQNDSYNIRCSHYVNADNPIHREQHPKKYFKI